MDRRKIGRLLLVVPLLVAGIALGTPRPAAAAYICTGGVNPAVIKDSVVVPAGTTCALSGVVVRGEVVVEPGGALQATGGTEIRGPVTATAAASLTLSNVVVRGGVTVSGGTGMAALTIINSQVRGNLVVTGNTTASAVVIAVRNNIVRGSIIVRDNSTTVAPIAVQGNAIEADLDCSGNSSNPIDGGIHNTVEGEATGQCAGLVAP